MGNGTPGKKVITVCHREAEGEMILSVDAASQMTGEELHRLQEIWNQSGLCTVSMEEQQVRAQLHNPGKLMPLVGQTIRGFGRPVQLLKLEA